MAKGYNLEQTGPQVQEAINKSLNLTTATQSKEGLMSAQDKQKLDSLDSELAGKVDKVQGKGLSTNDYDNTEKGKVASAYRKPVDGIPSSDLAEGVIPDTSQFITKTVNDLANYYLKTETYSRSETYSKPEVNALIALIKQFTYQVVSELPEASESTMHKLYLVPSADPQTQNVKDEYITIRSGSEGAYTYAWEQIGSTAINLSGYVTTEALNAALENYTTTANLTTLLAAKQDVIADLSTIRSGAAAGATAYQKPSGGVPKSDLASSVQTSLSKADTAIQPAEFNELEEEVGTIGNGAYEEAWDGSSEPVVADIPAGISVTYNSTSYTGTLAASASTVDKIYLVSDGNGNYDRYVTVESSGTYYWKKVGTTAIPLSEYASKAEFRQLEAKVDENGLVLDAGIVPTRNILLPSRKAVGLFVDGTDYGNTGYTTFFGILVEPSTKYVLSFDGSAHQYFRIRSKDANGQYIASSYQGGGYDYTTPANAKFVDLCFGDNTINGVSIQLEKVSVTPYIYPIKATDDLVVREQANGLVGLPAGTKEDASFTNETLTMTDYPEMAKVSGCLSFSGDVTAFDNILLGTNPFSTYGRIFCKITTTHIIFGTGIRTPEEIAYFKHGLTISTFIRGTFSWYDGHLEANVFTLGGSFHCEYDDRLRDIYGYPYVQAPSGTTLTNFRVSISNERFQCPVWIFGDSYISISNNRWPYYLYKQYNIKDFFLCGFAGGDSSEVYPMLVQALKYGCPKYLVWALGMNDKDGDGVPNESWKNIFDAISRVCKDLGIVFIPATIPCVPTDTCENAYKDAYVLANASRIWNAASDVGALNDTTWYEGLLSDDNVHPSVLGAQALAGSLLTQVPELMQYREVKRYGDAVGRNESLKNEMLTLSVSGKATDCYHNITATGETQILKSNLDLALVSEMYVDDLKITKSLTYNFTTTGIHKVSIVFADNTKIPGNSISGLTTLVHLKVGNEVETIDAWAIWGNSAMEDLVLGPKVIFVGYAGFHNSTSLKRIYSIGKVCPMVASGGAFGQVKANGKVFHLVDSYNYADFVSTDTNMLGAAGWTLQELVSNIPEF